jgi:hypothetical protein
MSQEELIELLQLSLVQPVRWILNLSFQDFVWEQRGNESSRLW